MDPVKFYLYTTSMLELCYAKYLGGLMVVRSLLHPLSNFKTRLQVQSVVKPEKTSY